MQVTRDDWVVNNENEYVMEVQKPGQASQRMTSKCETD